MNKNNAYIGRLATNFESNPLINVKQRYLNIALERNKIINKGSVHDNEEKYQKNVNYISYESN